MNEGGHLRALQAQSEVPPRENAKGCRQGEEDKIRNFNYFEIKIDKKRLAINWELATNNLSLKIKTGAKFLCHKFSSLRRKFGIYCENFIIFAYIGKI